MHARLLLCSAVLVFTCMGLHRGEAEAVRPPLKPLDTQNLQEMVADAGLIATGVVKRVSVSVRSEPPLELVTIRVSLEPDRILKGEKSLKTIEIEESYRRYPLPGGKGIEASVAGPAPPVGRYTEGERLLLFLESVDGRYRPLGSGNHDAYLGVLKITPDGVISDRYRLDETVLAHAGREGDFVNFIMSMERR